jgi:hypothetical protein
MKLKTNFTAILGLGLSDGCSQIPPGEPRGRRRSADTDVDVLVDPLFDVQFG